MFGNPAEEVKHDEASFRTAALDRIDRLSHICSGSGVGEFTE
jgi:hypothetical protein